MVSQQYNNHSFDWILLFPNILFYKKLMRFYLATHQEENIRWN